MALKIKFGGKVRGFQFGLGAVEIYCDMMGCDMIGLDMIATVCPEQPKAITSIVYAGLLNYAELNDQEIDFSYRKVQHWLDEAEDSTFAKIMEAFSASKMFGKTLSEHFGGGEAEEGEKKEE